MPSSFFGGSGTWFMATLLKGIRAVLWCRTAERSVDVHRWSPAIAIHKRWSHSSAGLAYQATPQLQAPVARPPSLRRGLFRTESAERVGLVHLHSVSPRCRPPDPHRCGHSGQQCADVRCQRQRSIRRPSRKGWRSLGPATIHLFRSPACWTAQSRSSLIAVVLCACTSGSSQSLHPVPAPQATWGTGLLQCHCCWVA